MLRQQDNAHQQPNTQFAPGKAPTPEPMHTHPNSLMLRIQQSLPRPSKDMHSLTLRIQPGVLSCSMGSRSIKPSKEAKTLGPELQCSGSKKPTPDSLTLSLHLAKYPAHSPCART